MVWVLRDLDPRMTALVRPRSNCTGKLQIRPLFREGAPQQEILNCKTKKKEIWSWAPDRSPTPRQTGRLIVGRNLISTSTSSWGSLKWDSKIWSWVLRDFIPRVIAVAKPKSICTSKLQTHPLVREGAPHKTPQLSDRRNNLVMSSRWEPDTKTYWPTDRRSQLNFSFKSSSISQPVSGME
jgi:hypothetical protein